MSTLILKFGGAALAAPEHFARVAQTVVGRRREYPHIAIVVSAMGDTTDELIGLARAVHPDPPKREYDMLVSAGERISISLLAMALDRMGEEAVSFTGSQSGIITCEKHTDAEILEVRPQRIQRVLEEGKIAIVAGFQGVSREKEITTLGRGGSDITAVALAAAVGADAVEFYKDVPGIFCSDPKQNDAAKHYDQLSYDEALALVDDDNPFLHRRCVEFAKEQKIPLRFCSFADLGHWTTVSDVMYTAGYGRQT